MSDALPMRYRDINKDFEKFSGVYSKVHTPYNHCIAVQFIGKQAMHVGIVYNNHVYNVSNQSKTRLKDTIKNFERKSRRTEYFKYDHN